MRNTYYTSLRDGKHESRDVGFDEEIHLHDDDAQTLWPSYGISGNPETLLAAGDTRRIVNAALEKLPQNFREAVVLKEMEELSYKEIAEIAGVPIGTVMSRLVRAQAAGRISEATCCGRSKWTVRNPAT